VQKTALLLGLTLALGAPNGWASTAYPLVTAIANLTGEVGGGDILVAETDLNVNDGNPNAVHISALPLLLTVGGLGMDECTGSSVSAAASAANVTEPAVLISASVAGTVCANGQGVSSIFEGGVSMTYPFQVVGPDASSVPVVFQGSNSTALSIMTGSTTASGSASAEILDASKNTVLTELGGAYDASLSLTPNVFYYVSLGAGLDIDTLSTVLTSAYADPSLTIDPSYSNADEYSIVYGPDLTQSGVPEPGAILLMGSGLLLLCLARGISSRIKDPSKAL